MKRFLDFIKEKNDSLRNGIQDCLVELNDIGSFETEIEIDRVYNKISVGIKVDESDVPDDDYFNNTIPFDLSTISEPILLLNSYILDNMGGSLSIRYYCHYREDYSNSDSVEELGFCPTLEYLEDIDKELLLEEEEGGIDSDEYNMLYMIKYMIKECTKIDIEYRW